MKYYICVCVDCVYLQLYHISDNIPKCVLVIYVAVCSLLAYRSHFGNIINIFVYAHTHQEITQQCERLQINIPNSCVVESPLSIGKSSPHTHTHSEGFIYTTLNTITFYQIYEYVRFEWIPYTEQHQLRQ